MNNIASIFILTFLFITFLSATYDKIFNWKDNVLWLIDYFDEKILKKITPLLLIIILVLELATSIFCAVGILELITNSGHFYSFYGSVFACITLLFLLIGQHIAKDYEGNKSLILYFILAVMATYWLN